MGRWLWCTAAGTGIAARESHARQQLTLAAIACIPCPLTPITKAADGLVESRNARLRPLGDQTRLVGVTHRVPAHALIVTLLPARVASTIEGSWYAPRATAIRAPLGDQTGAMTWLQRSPVQLAMACRPDPSGRITSSWVSGGFCPGPKCWSRRLKAIIDPSGDHAGAESKKHPRSGA